MCASKSTFNLAAAGQAFISRRLSVFDEKEFLSMIKIIREADASFVNLETSIHKFQEVPAQKIPADAYGQVDPFIAEELKWAGFNLISCANNHAMDYSIGGMIATTDHLEKVGLVHAGAGMHLAEAREAGYLDTKRGIVALVAMTTTSPGGFAGEQRPNLQGRPGLNPLGINTIYKLDQRTFETQKEIILRLESSQPSWTTTVATIGENEFTFLGRKFILAEEIGVEQTVNELDLQGNIKAIQDASKLADWVIVSVHYHEPALKVPEGFDPSEATPQFVQHFAHACIDAGADAFISHGHPRDKGIEIYKGKPIFYSIGNFSFQSTLIRRQPQDIFEQWGLNVLASAPDLYERREEPGRHFFDSDYIWESMIAVSTFDCASGELSELKLYPITLGLWELNREAEADVWTKWKPLKEVRTKLGRPKLADRELGEKIINRVARMSIPYGTQIKFRDGIGLVRVK